MQISPFCPVEPALHVQFVCVVLPAGALECAGHCSAIAKRNCASRTKLNAKIANALFRMLLFDILECLLVNLVGI